MPRSKKVDAESKQDQWLRIAYEETWRQYLHEDSLSNNRANTYFSIQSGLLILTAALIQTILGKNIDLWLSYQLIGSLLFVIGIIVFTVSSSWRVATISGAKWRELRRMLAEAIERISDIQEFGPASLESRWNNSSILFPDNEQLSDLHLQKPKSGATKSMLRVIDLFRTIGSLMVLGGITLIILSVTS
jgi:hypothetical protein